MAGKRKATPSDDGGARKKPNKATSTGGGSGNPVKQEVPWVMPTRIKDSGVRDDSISVTRYAQRLYNRPFEQLHTRQAPFGFPPYRTPIYKGYNVADLTAEKDTSQGSNALRTLYNAIKSDTERVKAVAGQALRVRGPYVRTAFEQAFENATEGVAVVASGSAGNAVRALEQNYYLQV
jgi:hypothetical protein